MEPIAVLQADLRDALEQLQVVTNRAAMLTGQLETAQASVTRWEAAYRSLAGELEKVHTEYRAECDRLNALNVALSRDLTDARNKVDVVSRASASFVSFYVDTFDSFDDVALSMETRVLRTLGREMLAHAPQVPM